MIDAHADVKEWDAAMRALEARQVRAMRQATTRGVLLVERLSKMYLRTYTHPRGTPTPSPPGGPPALVSGHLRRSWRTIPAHPGLRPDTCEASTGPTAAYSRIHELGGDIHQVRTSVGKRGMVTRAVTIRMPRRPYLRPMTRAARRDIHRGYVVAQINAIKGG